MRLWKRRSQESKEEAPDAKERFARIIRTVELLCLEDLTVMQREMVYDFALWTLGQQIAADGYASFISGTTVCENRDYDFLNLVPGLPEGKAEKAAIDLSKIPTYTAPWEYSRFPSGISSLMAHGFRQDLARNEGIYYPELRFAVMLSGRHHTAWGVFLGSCIQDVSIRSLTAFFPCVTTDGECFEYRDPSGACRTGKVPDYRFAAMYRIAQIKWEKGIRTEPPYASFGQTLDELQKKEEKDTEELSIEQLSQFYVDRCRDLRTRNYELTQEVQYLRQKQMPSQTSFSST